MRVGVIGMGSIGRRHAENLVSLGYRPVVYDTDLEQCGVADLTQRAPWDTSLEMERFWKEKPEAVLICTPPDTHIELAIDASEHGCKGIFIEKPLADQEGSKKGQLRMAYLQLGTVARKQSTMVACNWRFHQGPMQVKKWLNDGAIGTIMHAQFWSGSYLPDWVPGRDYKTSYVARTGVILDVGSHMVDLATWLVGAASLKASQWQPATSLDLECDGIADLILTHENGAMSTVHLNFVQRDRDMGCKIIGTEGSIEWSKEICSVYLYDSDGLLVDDECCEEDIEQMYVEEMKHFLTCCEQGIETCNPVSQAAKTLGILLEAKGK